MLLSVGRDLEERAQASLNSGAGPSSETFDEIAAEVRYLLRHDVFPRFISSPQYFKLANLTLEECMQMEIGQFNLYRLLGAGGFGMILLARHRHSGKFFACKVIDKRIVLSQSQVHAVFRERETLSAISHPFICGLHSSFQTEHSLCLLLDFIEAGNMYSDLMHGAYSPSRAMFYAAQVALALDCIHSQNILYRDLKPDNILLDMQGYLKVADMGAARGISVDGFICSQNMDSLASVKTARVRDGDETRQRRMTITGTHGYRAPEVYQREYGTAADWWNMGILIYEMLTTTNPLRGDNRKESELLTKTVDVALPSTFSEETRDIINAFFHKDPSKRLGSMQDADANTDDAFRRIRAHPYFTGIDWEALLRKEMLPPFAITSTNLTPTPLELQRTLTPETNRIDYFAQTVDYMAMSLKLRRSWVLSEDEQRRFDGFEHISTAAIEDAIEAPTGSWQQKSFVAVSRRPGEDPGVLARSAQQADSSNGGHDEVLRAARAV